MDDSNLIASGAHGDVHIGLYKGQKCAAKMIEWRNGNILQNWAIIEPAMYQYVSHPCIIKPYEISIDEKYVTIYMPYIEEKITDCPRETLPKVFFHLLDTLAYLQKKKVLHRDLRCSNILFDGDKPILIDFGLGKFYCSDSILSSAYSDHVRPPEIITEAAEYSEKAEVWAAGIVLYRILTGVYPYDIDSENPLKVYIDKIGPDEKDLREFCEEYIGSVPYKTTPKSLMMYGDLGRICKRMLHFSPKNRPTFEELLQDPFFAKYERYISSSEHFNTGNQSIPWEEKLKRHLILEYGLKIETAHRFSQIFVNDYSLFKDNDLSLRNILNMLKRSNFRLVPRHVY